MAKHHSEAAESDKAKAPVMAVTTTYEDYTNGESAVLAAASSQSKEEFAKSRRHAAAARRGTVPHAAVEQRVWQTAPPGGDEAEHASNTSNNKTYRADSSRSEEPRRRRAQAVVSPEVQAQIDKLQLELQQSINAIQEERNKSALELDALQFGLDKMHLEEQTALAKQRIAVREKLVAVVQHEDFDFDTEHVVPLFNSALQMNGSAARQGMDVGPEFMPPELKLSDSAFARQFSSNVIRH